MKFITCFLFTLLTFFTSFSQKEEQNIDVTKVITANFFYPGISYEARLGKHQTFFVSAFMNILAVTRFSGTRFFVGPAIALQYRNYYNLAKRAKNGLRTEMNSANYIGPIVFGTYSKNSRHGEAGLSNIVGFVWGLQRNYVKRFSLDVNAGLGYLFSDINFSNNNSITLINQVRLGFWLNKKKS